jgi:hypothetical protein
MGTSLTENPFLVGFTYLGGEQLLTESFTPIGDGHLSKNLVTNNLLAISHIFTMITGLLKLFGH